MKIDIEATAEELDEIGEAIVEQLPHLISDALDRQLSLPGYNVTVNAGAGLTAKLRADIASIREDTKAIIQHEMKRTAECIRLRDELAAALAQNVVLLEFYKASRQFESTCGHEDATVADERSAELRYNTALSAVESALIAGGAA